MTLSPQLTKLLVSSNKQQLKEVKFVLQHPEYQHYPVSIKEYIENPQYTNPEDKPRKHNKKLLIDIFDSGTEEERLNSFGKYEEILYIAGIGSGKCLAKGTKIIKYSGEIDVVENIKKNDLLMGWDSKPRKVISLSKGEEELYKITPIKGESFIVNKSHILSLKRTNKGIINKNGNLDKQARKIVNISVEDYLKLSKKMKGILKLWRVGIDFKEKKINIDPYFLGLWLGDGNNHNVGVATQDKEIKDTVYAQAKKFNLIVNINQNKNKTCPTYIITSGIKGGNKNRNKILKVFKKYKLLNNKHIPLNYKTNSRKIRLQLLAGLIDSDGSQSKNCLEFSNKNKKLINDVVFLCRSLGFAAYVKQRITSYNNKQFISYRVSISGNLEEIPIRLLRKKCSKRKQKKDVLVTGFKIENIGIGNYYGFDLNKDHLYLLGDFTVTHNSYIASKAMEYMVFRLLCFKDPARYFNFAKGTKIAFINISKSFSQAKDIVFGEIKNRLDNSPWFSKFYPADPRIKSKMRLPKNIYILPLGSNEEAPLGYNIFGAVIDEASFHVITKDKDYAFEAYNQIKKRIKSRFLSRGKLFIITSPRYVYDFAENKFRDDTNKKLFKMRTPLWEATPKEFYSGKKFDLGEYIKEREGVKIPIEYEDEFKQNPEKALRDYGAEPSMAIQGLFRDPTIIPSAVNKSRKSPINISGSFEDWFINSRSNKKYDPEKRFIHVDLALNKEGKGDCAGIAMGKFNGWEKLRTLDGKIERRPKIYIDYMEKIRARPKEEILFSDVRNKIYKLRDMGYNIALVSYDGWQSIDSIQTLKEKGFHVQVLSVDKTTEPYYTLKEALLTDRLDFYYNKDLISELQQLEEVNGRKIDHPRRGSKDLSDAVAGVCYHCSKRTPGRGFLGAG